MLSPDRSDCAWCGNDRRDELRLHRSGKGYICIDGNACAKRTLLGERGWLSRNLANQIAGRQGRQ